MQWRLGRSEPSGAPGPFAGPGSSPQPDARTPSAASDTTVQAPAAPTPTASGSSTRWRARRGWLPWLALSAVALLAAAALWRTVDLPTPYTDDQARAAASSLIESAQKEAAQQPPAAAAAYTQIAPSLVVIRTRGAGEGGLGTGFVANADGTILTAHHVVDGGGSIEITFADGTTSSASIASAEPERDLATLTPARLPEVVVPATLGAAGPIGSSVHAAGNPLGLTFSLSSGVISATGRTIDTGSVKLTDLIQFDAAVNPGNSGGPLIDDGGRVVGVVTALANPSKQPFFVGIGFAVPISQAGGALGAAPM